MEITIATDLSNDPAARSLISHLESRKEDLELNQANLYYNFPLYRDEEEGGLITTKVLLISREHGVFVLGTSNATADDEESLFQDSESLDHVFSHVFARMLKNRRLRKTKQDLQIPIAAALYAPNLETLPAKWNSDDTPLLHSDHQVDSLIGDETWEADDALYQEVISTIEGAKGLIRPAKRETAALAPTAKGRLAAQLESEITTFDRQQKHGSIISFDGPQRIRGLAGSGKTVVLAMKAALAHLREPDARILYTFWTKSLYQHVRRLITRFYRQFDDRDPNWSKLQVLHGWGSAALPGTYYVAASTTGIDALTFQDAFQRNPRNPFGYACEQVLKAPLKPIYDYIFIDEGQDYPSSFIRLCAQIAESDRFVIAYDELQNIFQTESPSAAEIFGVNTEGKATKEFATDIVLHKCYRNPREVLVCAHAVGFGIYAKHIVQMLENKEHWEDIGYSVIEGTFEKGSATVIERPAENSLASISKQNSIDEIVNARAFKSIDDEIAWVIDSIERDIAEGLKPEDILVITVDDRNAKSYLVNIATELEEKHIQANNIHGAFGGADFQQEERVTLSTVHKAKGNEAFMVYVVGADALYPNPTVRQRNMLFAAMTRAKGWLRVTGISPSADECVKEISNAKSNFPELTFVYPGAAEMKVMRRDLEEATSRRMRAERLLEEAATEMSPDEIEDLLRRFSSSAIKSGGKKKTRPSKRTRKD